MKQLLLIILLSAPLGFIYPQPSSPNEAKPFSAGTNENYSSYIFRSGGKKYLIDEIIMTEYQEGLGVSPNPEKVYINKFKYKYHGSQVRKTRYGWGNSGWEKEIDRLYEYNSRGLITLYSSYLFIEKTKRAKRETEYYTYDNAGRLLQKSYSREDSYLGSHSRWYYYTYNSAGDLISFRRDETLADSVGVTEELFKTYDDGHNVIDSFYIWNRGAGETGTKFRFTRNESGYPLTLTHTSIKSGTESLIDSILYSYDDFGRLKTEHRISWRDSHSLNEYSYNAAGLIEKRESKNWNNQKTGPSHRDIYIYDAYGKLIRKASEYWDDNSSSWEPRRASAYSYDNYGNCIEAAALEYLEGKWILSRSNTEIEIPGMSYFFFGYSVKISYIPLK